MQFVAANCAPRYDELVEARGEVGNFSSFLRVSALRYMALQAHDRSPMDNAIPIRSLDAKAVLHALPAHWALPQHGARNTVVPLRRKG